MVAHRTGEGNKPGPVVAHAPLQAGENIRVVAFLSEEVNPGLKLMPMLHGKEVGMKPGVFEYTLGAKEDGPVKSHGKPVMNVITAI